MHEPTPLPTPSAPASSGAPLGARPGARLGAPAEAERCLRCAAWMEWRHGTWQCPRCRFKIGCCEGPTAECFTDR